MQARARITVGGEVQGVGYRYFAARIARRWKLIGEIRNLEDGRVEIICEGERSDIEEFVREIKIKEPPISVESTEVVYEEPKGEFKSFGVIAGELPEEMIEGFSTGAVYLTAVRKELGEFREESKTNFLSLDGKYHSVSTELKSINQNTAKLAENISKSNELLTKIVKGYVDTSRRRGKG